MPLCVCVCVCVSVYLPVSNTRAKLRKTPISPIRSLELLLKRLFSELYVGEFASWIYFHHIYMSSPSVMIELSASHVLPPRHINNLLRLFFVFLLIWRLLFFLNNELL